LKVIEFWGVWQS